MYQAGYKISDGNRNCSGFKSFYSNGVIDSKSHLSLPKENQYNTIEQYQAFQHVTGNNPNDNIMVKVPFFDSFAPMAMYGTNTGQIWYDKTAYDLYFSDGISEQQVWECKAKEMKLVCPVGEPFAAELTFIGKDLTYLALTGSLAVNTGSIYKQLAFKINGTGYLCDGLQINAAQSISPLMGNSGFYQDLVDNTMVKTTIGVGFQAEASIMDIYKAGMVKDLQIDFIHSGANYVFSGLALCYSVQDMNNLGLPTHYVTMWACGDGWSRV